jgi:hypothetical protein
MKRLRRLLVAPLKGEQAVLEFAQGREIVRRHDLALDDREVDLYLVQPARMHWSVYERQSRPLRTKTSGSFFAPVRRAVVCDPEDAARGPIGLRGHHLLDEPVDRANGRLRFAPAKQCRAMHIPPGEVRQRTGPEVLVFDAHRTSRAGRQRPMLAAARLETRFLIGRDDEFLGSQRSSIPGSGIQIQHASGFSRRTADLGERSSYDDARVAAHQRSTNATR